MDRVSQMRFRESNLETPPELDSEALSLSPSPPPRVGFNLSSMVVKPSANNGGGSDIEIGYADDEHLPPRRRLDSLQDPFRRLDSLQDTQRRDSPSSVRRRGSSSPLHRRRSPDGFHRRVSQTVFHRRGSPIGVHRRGSSLAFHPRPQRLRNDQGYMQRPDSISPPRRLRADDGYYEPDFGRPNGHRPGRGMRGRGGRFRRDISPTTFGRDSSRPYSRGFDSSTHAISASEDEFVHRNDPNLSPREGDWICQNPSCGNLNFARRTYCNNCHKYRFDEPYGSSRSPPPRRSFSPNLPLSPIDRPPRRDFNGYRSPPPPQPRHWDTDHPREFNMNLIPTRRGGKFVDPIRRGRIDFHKDSFRERGGFDRSAASNWERPFIPESRVSRHPISPPHGRPIRDARDRSRSPIAGRLPRGSFVGRARDDRRYDGPYVGNRQADDDLDAAAPGRGYRLGGARGRRADVF